MTSRTTDSSPLQAPPEMGWLNDIWHPPGPQEMARREEGAQRFAQLFSSNPYYKARSERDPDYWHKLYAGNVKL